MFAVYTLIWWAVAGHAPDWTIAVAWLAGSAIAYLIRKAYE